MRDHHAESTNNPTSRNCDPPQPAPAPASAITLAATPNHSRYRPHPSRGITNPAPLSDNSPLTLPSVSRTGLGAKSRHYSSISTLPNMETYSYNGMQAERQNPYMSSAYYGLGSQVASNGLSILDSDTYNDGRILTRNSNLNEPREFALPFTVNQDSEPRTESDEQEKSPKGKRKRRMGNQQDDDEEARKKARGRPRVEPKDETAADRRRTQIRMAQRAYRNRKETTITTLEKQVQDLRGTNEEMSNIFISLYDFAVGQGLLQREPEFGQQLQSTTQRFLALVRANSQDDESHDDNAKEDSTELAPEPARKSKNTRSTKKIQAESQVQLLEERSLAPWGYNIQEDDGSTPTNDTQVMSLDVSQQTFQYPRNNNLQVITRPTEDNASFSFDSSDMMNVRNFRVEVPPMVDYAQNFIPQSQLPLPDSMAFNEFSLARRLHRNTTERALQLITALHPSPKRFDEVFKLALMYETREEIIARVKRVTEKPINESLQVWQHPFVHTGGSGTFYPVHDGGDLMPKFRTGYSMGPFSAQVSQVQELMEDDMRCTLPGYEGEFFDANDVEGYLRGRGLEIPPTADYVTAELDLSEFSGSKSSSSRETATDISPRTPRSLPDAMLVSGNSSQTLDFSNSASKVHSTPISLNMSWNSGAQIDQLWDKAMERPDDGPDTPPLASSKTSRPQRQIVHLNVNVLIHGIDHRLPVTRSKLTFI